MAYGETMKKLSPCDSALVLALLGEYAPEPGALLDAGCGRGDRLADCARAWPETRLCGIDSDGENAAAAREACPGAEIVTGDVCALPWPGRCFDAALCECTLSLLEDPAACLTELWRVLRPGGVLLLSEGVVNKTLPIILCDEEDVEGTHGASIGRLSPEVLFYMQTRGMSKQEAELLMTRAKLNSVRNLIHDEHTHGRIQYYMEEVFR